jgi:hypothetical protein
MTFLSFFGVVLILIETCYGQCRGKHTDDDPRFFFHALIHSQNHPRQANVSLSCCKPIGKLKPKPQGKTCMGLGFPHVQYKSPTILMQLHLSSKS